MEKKTYTLEGFIATRDRLYRSAKLWAIVMVITALVSVFGIFTFEREDGISGMCVTVLLPLTIFLICHVVLIEKKRAMKELPNSVIV